MEQKKAWCWVIIWSKKGGKVIACGRVCVFSFGESYGVEETEAESSVEPYESPTVTSLTAS